MRDFCDEFALERLILLVMKVIALLHCLVFGIIDLSEVTLDVREGVSDMFLAPHASC